MAGEARMTRASEPPTGKMPEPASRPATGTDTVTVACKVPNGIEFGLYVMVEDQEPIMGGGWKTVKKANPTGETVRLRGPGPALAAMRRGVEPSESLAAGFALTPGIPREHWEKVRRDYADHPAIVNGLVFATDSDVDAMAEARNRRSVETGLEGIDPDNPAKRTGIRQITKGETPNAAAAA